MSSLRACLSQAAYASCARSESVRDGILACASLDDPDLALSEMLLVAQDALVQAYMSVESISRVLDETPDVPEQVHQTYNDVVSAISCEATYLSALVSFLVEQLTPPTGRPQQRSAVDSLCTALLEMNQ